jgi:hypothetical protein
LGGYGEGEVLDGRGEEGRSHWMNSTNGVRPSSWVMREHRSVYQLRQRMYQSPILPRVARISDCPEAMAWYAHSVSWNMCAAWAWLFQGRKV